MKPMSNLTLKHLMDYIESPHQRSGTIAVSPIYDTVGQGGYGIVEEPCGVNTSWIPPITILPPKDYSTRGYND
mgnify:CR=1 FL=1